MGPCELTFVDLLIRIWNQIGQNGLIVQKSSSHTWAGSQQEYQQRDWIPVAFSCDK